LFYYCPPPEWSGVFVGSNKNSFPNAFYWEWDWVTVFGGWVGTRGTGERSRADDKDKRAG
jgi:hypothetical protein